MPKTTSGAPDLSGIWNFKDSTPFERPMRISWGAASCDRPEDFGLASRFLMFPLTGPPHVKANSYNNNLRFVETAAGCPLPDQGQGSSPATGVAPDGR